MIVFALSYIVSFLWYLKALKRGEPEKIFIFFIAGMSVYTMAMSTTMQATSALLVNLIKYFKELAVGSCFAYLFFTRFKAIRLVKLDWLIILLFAYSAAYTVLPVGDFTFIEKVTVFKSYGLFGLLYFIGRWIPKEKFNSRQLIFWVIGLLVVASLIQFAEVLSYRHLQSLTGYSDYNQKINQLYSSGTYGLTQTFETDLGVKRFASFFHDPLDFAITLVLGICLMVSWIHTYPEDGIPKKWKWIILFVLLFALYKTYSRASILGAAIALFYYVLTTKKVDFLKYLIGFVIAIGFYTFFFLENKFRDYLIDTLLFRESSALSHLLAWLTGIEAIAEQPFGLGLGSSGNYAFSDGPGVGGENQLIFMGVQTGIVSLILYLIIFFWIWRMAARGWKNFNNYDKTLVLGLALFKAGSFVPMLTSYFESFLFMSYFTWAVAGYLTSLSACQNQSE